MTECQPMAERLRQKHADILGPDYEESIFLAAAARIQELEGAVTRYLSVFDRCGGSESVAAEEFATARDGLRAALEAKP